MNYVNSGYTNLTTASNTAYFGMQYPGWTQVPGQLSYYHDYTDGQGVRWRQEWDPRSNLTTTRRLDPLPDATNGENMLVDYVDLVDGNHGRIRSEAVVNGVKVTKTVWVTKKAYKDAEKAQEAARVHLRKRQIKQFA